MTSRYQAPAHAYEDRCECGREFESLYSAFYKECRECERLREFESEAAADMLMHGFGFQS